MSGSSSIISGIQALAASLLIVFAGPLLAQECDLSGSNISREKGDYEAAFSKLKGCENDSAATGSSLLSLAFFYAGYHAELTTPEKRLSEKIYSLLLRAALLGEPGAIAMLASIYRAGEPMLSIEPQPKKEKCLLDIEYNPKPPFDLDAIRECLNIQG